MIATPGLASSIAPGPGASPTPWTIQPEQSFAAAAKSSGWWVLSAEGELVCACETEADALWIANLANRYDTDPGIVALQALDLLQSPEGTGRHLQGTILAKKALKLNMEAVR